MLFAIVEEIYIPLRVTIRFNLTEKRLGFQCFAFLIYCERADGYKEYSYDLLNHVNEISNLAKVTKYVLFFREAQTKL